MIEVLVEDEGWNGMLPDAPARAERAAMAAGGDGAVILLASDERLAALNARFRGRTGPTNVLSFPSAGGEASGGHLGDVALALGVCATEARDQGKTLADHLAHLVVHGVLHLRGYDHQTPKEAARLESRERAILAKLGIADPYVMDDKAVDGADKDDHVSHSS